MYLVSIDPAEQNLGPVVESLIVGHVLDVVGNHVQLGTFYSIATGSV